MDFAFSEEQQMLRDSARSFLESKFDADRVAELAQSDEGWDASSWTEIAELGWVGLSVPEDQGGAGFGFIEEAVLFEELGRALYPGPYFSTVALALPALNGTDVLADVLTGKARATFAWAEPSGPHRLSDLENLSTKASGSNGSWTLSGEKAFVPDAAIADVAVVAAAAPEGTGLFAAKLSDAEVRPASTMDTTRRLGSISFNETPATLAVAPDRASEILEKVRLRSLAAAALEAVGVAQTALDLAQDYVKERKQFDKPIGAYQAVSHQVADTYMETELARSLAYWAAWCVAESDEQAAVAVAAAKSAAGEAAVHACERSIQVHGGIGFTWEHILHRYYKRAQWLAAFEGFDREHRKAVAATILD
ncbi:MAG TPA: acyl-CoA dehydrogenase family protein [Actinomycetota bacterium]|nr:acyl-CoA dehydrogenase family protein [Actinomycetota bacterium]